MRRKFLLISTIVVLGLVGLTACGKKAATSEATTEATTEDTEDVSTVATDTETEATTKATTEATTATKKDENTKKSASGVYDGFGDDNSVEIKLDSGKYQTFIVADNDVANQLNDMKIGTKISFTYGPLAGQSNMQILSVKAK